jgi:sortase A
LKAVDARNAATGGLLRIRRIAENAAWAAGLVVLLGCGFWYLAGITGSRQALTQFAELNAAAGLRTPAVDVSLWSEERIAAWRSTLQLPGPAPLGVLRISRIGLEVPVLEGTDELTLNRGVGHIEDTAAPGLNGNAGIAGHRDGFFRGLKDVSVGDIVELETLPGRKQHYRIDQTWIVSPEDVWVIDPTPTRSLTLVTCYPFYFIGAAPKRFIVRAVRSD